VIKADPTAMTYAAVFNLCTLYDLQVSGNAGSCVCLPARRHVTCVAVPSLLEQGANGLDRKRMMARLAKTYASEDFDLSACKL